MGPPSRPPPRGSARSDRFRVENRQGGGELSWAAIHPGTHIEPGKRAPMNRGRQGGGLKHKGTEVRSPHSARELPYGQNRVSVFAVSLPGVES